MDLARDEERMLQVAPVRVHHRFLRRITRRSARASDRARTGSTGTCASVDLCSTPSRFCAALRSDPADAGPADLDGVCAQLANLALTCRPWSACWPGAPVP